MNGRRFLSAGMAALMACGLLTFGAAPAQARENSNERLWKYGTYAGAAGTALALLKRKHTWALVGAGATALSYTQWKREADQRNRRERLARERRQRLNRQSSYQQGYRAGLARNGNGRTVRNARNNRNVRNVRNGRNGRNVRTVRTVRR
jgi:hypothetical protein